MPFQACLNRCLNKALRRGVGEGAVRIPGEGGVIIFSDLHKGMGDRADDFVPCESTYLDALDYYEQQKFHLVLDGDVEDIWESEVPAILLRHDETLVREMSFHKAGRLIRIIGNHDNYWLVTRRVEKVFGKRFPSFRMRRELLLEIPLNDNQSFKVLVVHGHEATLDSYYLSGLAQVAVKVFWRAYQNLTGKGRTSLSDNHSLVAGHDTQMYRWACGQAGLILIAGHTHRPVWCSQTHHEKLIHTLRTLQSGALQYGQAEMDVRIQQLEAEILKRMEDTAPRGDTVKTRPCYFNAGCCSFGDGDITGIEIDTKEIRLVTWSAATRPTKREVLEQAKLDSIYMGVKEALTVS